ncbi:MAG TPA: glycosyltransferase family A protein [Gemmatimonadaceae bacterium]|nr:glycosyltransferase family A protein [Gemmatimonadaceae bacterium]
MGDQSAAIESVTYLIANHNLGRYIGECLSSLVAQTNPNWLALVVDDASTDESREVIARCGDPRVRMLVNDDNLGYIATLRRLIAEATTDIVAILDADDAVSADATEHLLAAYQADSDTEFVFSRFAACDDRLAVQRVWGAAVPEGSTALLDGVVGHIRSFRRRAYRRTAGLDDSMLYAEDRDLVYKLEEITRPVFVDAILYRYREVPDSQSRDVAKRETGARNTWRARRAALRRRRVSGLQRLAYEIFFWSDYVAYSNRTPRSARTLATWLSRLARLILPRSDPRSPE